ncbi:MAG TPA: O-antigen ligase family protein [Thermomicrobiales bacterium]
MSEQTTPALPVEGRVRRGVINGSADLRAAAVALAKRIGRQRLLALLFLLIVIASPWPPLSIIALLAYVTVTWSDPGWTTALIPLAAPFAYVPKAFPSPRAPDSSIFFPVIELLLLIALATSALHILRHWRREATAGAGAAALLDLWDEAKRLLGGHFGLQATALALLGLFSLLTIADPLHLRESVREYRTIVIEPVLYFFLARAWLRDRELRLAAIAAFIGGALLVSLLAIGQVLTGQGVVAVSGVRRALGTYQHPNALALYLVRAAAFALGLLVLAPTPRRARWLLGAIPFLLLALVLTFSRGALIGLGIGAALLAFAYLYRPTAASGEATEAPSSLRVVLLAACGLYAVAALVVTILSLTGTVNLRGGDSLGLREMIWRSALAMIRDHPAFGVGLDQFYYQYAPRYINPAAWGERYTAHPHNLLLDFWVRLGIMGLAWIVWMFASLAFAIARGWRASADDMRRVIIAAAVAFTAAFIHGLVDNFYFLIDLAFVWWFLLALLAIASEGVVITPTPDTQPDTQTARGARRQRRSRDAKRGTAVALPEGQKG